MAGYNEGGNFFAFSERLRGKVSIKDLRATTSRSVILWFSLSDRLALINNDKRSRPPRLSPFSPVPKAAALLSSSSPWPICSRFSSVSRTSVSKSGCWVMSMKPRGSKKLTRMRRAGIKLFSRFKLKDLTVALRSKKASCRSLDCALTVRLNASKSRLNPAEVCSPMRSHSHLLTCKTDNVKSESSEPFGTVNLDLTTILITHSFQNGT